VPTFVRTLAALSRLASWFVRIFGNGIETMFRPVCAAIALMSEVLPVPAAANDQPKPRKRRALARLEPYVGYPRYNRVPCGYRVPSV
jgi:hypothetical protein